MDAMNNICSKTEALKDVCVFGSDWAGAGMLKKGFPFTECAVSHLIVVVI